MTTTSEVTLDVIDIGENLLDYLVLNQISYDIITECGPSGWPEVRFTGKRGALENLIDDFFDDDYLLELILPIKESE